MADPMFKFDGEKTSALGSIYDSAGFQVVLDIMEKFCDKAENDFIATSPSDREGVLSAHAIMHAQRKFFQQVCEKIDYLVGEQRGGEVKNTAAKRTTSIK